VRLLANPVLLRAVAVFFLASFGFAMGLIFIRLLRKSIHDEATIDTEPAHSLETLQLNVYNTVIQQLKQQKNELDAQSKSEQQRARVNETISQSVISNLSSGVLVFGTNGLVKSCNPAAKQILGFVSAVGMSADDIFRGALVQTSLSVEATLSHGERLADDASQDASGSDPIEERSTLADEVDAVLHAGAERRVAQAEYETPSGDSRFLSVNVSPVFAADGGLLAVICLIDDLSEFERMRSRNGLHVVASSKTAAAASGTSSGS
jgi:nitrogen fixation/metabolism regulation signal transduction histidine kinase